MRRGLGRRSGAAGLTGLSEGEVVAVILTTGRQPDGRCKGPEVGKGWRDFKRTPGRKPGGGHLTRQLSRAGGRGAGRLALTLEPLLLLLIQGGALGGRGGGAVRGRLRLRPVVSEIPE